MMEWKEVKVSDMGKVITGNTPPRKNPELYGNHTIFIKPTDMSEERKYTYNPEECYSEEGFKKYKSSLIPKGSTCVVTIGSIGKKMTKAHCDCFVNQAVNAVVPFDNFDEEFVFYVLKYNLEQVKTMDSGTASGRENVSKSSFSNMKINVPIDKKIQIKIGKTLAAYDDLIENNLRRIKLLEELAQRTYEEWFVKFRVNGEQLVVNEETGLPMGWEKKKLIEVAFVNKNSLKKGFSGKLKYVDISSVSTGNIDSFTEYEFEDAPGRAKRVVKHGDIIWSCVRPNRKSYCLICNPEENLIVSTGFAVITPIKLPTSYLYLFVTTEAFVGYLTNLASGAAYPAVTSNVFENAEVVIPTEDLLDSYDGKIRPTIELIEKLTIQNRHLKESRDLLLPRLMSGALAVKSEE